MGTGSNRSRRVHQSGDGQAQRTARRRLNEIDSRD
jgi:hypothetical protein